VCAALPDGPVNLPIPPQERVTGGAGAAVFAEAM
jgi:hypothetical protein